MKTKNKKVLTLIFFFFLLSFKQKDSLIIQSTTSLQDAGFYNHLIKNFSMYDSVKIKVVAVGTGQAIKNSKNCDGDILLVHHKPSEISFIKNGYGLFRKEIMYNDYVLIGPKNLFDSFKSINNITEALELIYYKQLNFVSRGDESGTHKKEKELWEKAGININIKKDKWYFEAGSGMGASLNFAVNKSAFVLADRSTWLAFGNKKNHKIIVENFPNLLNYYGIIPINPKKCPRTNILKAKKLINWLESDIGKDSINSFRVNGKQVFFTGKN